MSSLRGRDQGRGLRTGRGRILRPAAGFADIDEGELGLRKTLRDFAKQRRFLGAGDGERRAVGQRLPEAVEFEAAELVGLRDPAAQPRPIAAASSGMVFSQLQIRR